MRFFFISAVGFTVVLLIFFAVKATIRAALWKEFERSEAASASAGQVSASSSPVQTSQGANAVQDQKGSRRVESGGARQYQRPFFWPSYAGQCTRRGRSTSGCFQQNKPGESRTERNVGR